ncbi:MAG: hypothetical protein ACOY3P_24205, partial [Planctomycetota bacterium]
KVDSARYIGGLGAYIEAIRAVDPTVKIIVDGQPAELAAEIHRKLGGRIDFFAVHHYQPWGIHRVERDGKPVDATKLSARDVWYGWVSMPKFDGAGQSVLSRRELEQARKLGYRVAITEWNWNGWWAVPSVADRPEFNSLLSKGVGAAGILHAMMREGDVVGIGAQSLLIGDRWDIHAICCDRNGRSTPYMV